MLSLGKNRRVYRSVSVRENDSGVISVTVSASNIIRDVYGLVLSDAEIEMGETAIEISGFREVIFPEFMLEGDYSEVHPDDLKVEVVEKGFFRKKKVREIRSKHKVVRLTPAKRTRVTLRIPLFKALIKVLDE